MTSTSADPISGDGPAIDSARSLPLPGDEDLREFLENGSVPFHWVAADGTILRANRAALELLGYEEREYVGRSVADLHADPETFADLVERRALGERLKGFEARLRCKDGSIKDVLIDSTVWWHDGAPIHTASFRDISDQREADAAAFRLSAIVESSDDAIVSKDLNGIVHSWNAGAEQLFGYQADEVIGRSIRLLIPDDLQAEEDEILRRVRRGEPIEHFDTVRRRKDGTLVPVSLTVSPVRDRRGRIVGASKIARDITKRREAEEAVQRSIELKDQFLGLVSHELRTPVSTIVGNAQLLQRRIDRLSEAARAQALFDIANEGDRLHRIIENLLVLTRLEATGESVRDSIEPRALAEDAIAIARRRAPRRSISLRVDDGTPIGIGDETLATLVLQNLISNADKYSPPEAEIEVIVRRGDHAGPVFHVLDRGHGIAPEDIDNVFEPFFRSESTKTLAPGMGLGLAVCRRIADAQGGAVRVESRPGGGSDFAFSLPAFELAAPHR